MSRCCEFVHDGCRPVLPLAAEVLEGAGVAVAVERPAQATQDAVVEGLLVWAVGVLSAVAIVLVGLANVPGLLP